MGVGWDGKEEAGAAADHFKRGSYGVWDGDEVSTAGETARTVVGEAPYRSPPIFPCHKITEALNES